MSIKRDYAKDIYISKDKEDMRFWRTQCLISIVGGAMLLITLIYN